MASHGDNAFSRVTSSMFEIFLRFDSFFVFILHPFFEMSDVLEMYFPSVRIEQKDF